MMFQKKENRKKLWRGIALGILCFVIIDILLMCTWYGASGVVLDKDWVVESTGKHKVVDIPYIDIVDTEGTIVLSREFDLDSTENLGLVIPYVSGTAFAAYINGELVGNIGKIGNSTANIWYTSFVYPLENVKAGRNSITIEIYGLYDVGFQVPPYIEDYDKAVRKVYLSGKVRNNLILTLGGMSIAFGLLLLIAFFKQIKKNRTFLFAAIIGLLAYFAVVDCIFDVGTSTIQQFLFIKKMRFAVIFLSLALISLIFYHDKGGGKNKLIPSVIVVVTILLYIPIAVSQSFYDWYTWMWISFYLQGVNIAIMFYLTLSSKRYKTMNIMMCVLIFFTFTQGLLSNQFGLNVPNPMQFAFIAVSLLIGVQYTSHLNEVFDKNQHLEIVSKVDALTGAYNRRMIDLVECVSGDCIILLDIDNLKSMNDNHGHEEGDRVLKELVHQISNITRKSDALIRMGGDEFCIILKDCTIEKAKEKMDILSRAFRDKFSNHDIDISYGHIMFEETLEKSLTKADALMYEMKAIQKNKRL